MLKPSPVLPYIVLELVGSMTIVVTARLAIKSLTGVHPAPLLVERQMPPPTLPTHIFCGLSGSMRTERMRPPILPGPNHSQAFGPMPAL